MTVRTTSADSADEEGRHSLALPITWDRIAADVFMQLVVASGQVRYRCQLQPDSGSFTIPEDVAAELDFSAALPPSARIETIHEAVANADDPALRNSIGPARTFVDPVFVLNGYFGVSFYLEP